MITIKITMMAVLLIKESFPNKCMNEAHVFFQIVRVPLSNFETAALKAARCSSFERSSRLSKYKYTKKGLYNGRKYRTTVQTKTHSRVKWLQA